MKLLAFFIGFVFATNYQYFNLQVFPDNTLDNLIVDHDHHLTISDLGYADQFYFDKNNYLAMGNRVAKIDPTTNVIMFVPVNDPATQTRVFGNYSRILSYGSDRNITFESCETGHQIFQLASQHDNPGCEKWNIQILDVPIAN
ncbi:hypothetical protein NEOLI_003322 [Neolecta irregularis DAH-3]|uniref:Uncharacterized protein n=1 Tax=Neolecta irregularis (strain DAH-3) TaxID=1198029 RepID=A0A1U7LRL0_NEOID|nr:hypothetical protein NEOLI_003322 [Neolecta irregularis DAH-3]|eukprot:OLL25310.1 hypothetical protein NEOLI_003322 [Neolecta irregularis DAH-3]